MNLVAAALCIAYITALPWAKAGQYYNFYAKKRLTEPLQRACDLWCNFWGIIIWRVFTIDNTNFYIKVWFEDRATGRRHLHSRPQDYDFGSGLRYLHVCEFVCLVSVFTTLKYYSADSSLFSQRLDRYARTLPCPKGHTVVFEWVDIRKESGRFEDVVSREFRWNPEDCSIGITDLQDGSTETDQLRYSQLVTGNVVGSYAPFA